jgi:hypothetical protein
VEYFELVHVRVNGRRHFRIDAVRDGRRRTYPSWKFMNKEQAEAKLAVLRRGGQPKRTEPLRRVREAVRELLDALQEANLWP